MKKCNKSRSLKRRKKAILRFFLRECFFVFVNKCINDNTKLYPVRYV